MKIRSFLIVLFCATGFFFVSKSDNVFAADAAVIFGSDSYENESGAEFPVGVYVDGDEEIGYYNVEIEYDPERLRYIDGATQGGDGKIIFEGTGYDVRVSTMLRFEALSGGETRLEIKEAKVFVADTDGETFNITEKATVPIKLNGEDVVAARQTEVPAESTSEHQEETEAETTSNANSDKRGEMIEGGSFVIGMAAILAGILATILIVLGVRKRNRAKQDRIERKEQINRKISTDKEADIPVVRPVVKPVEKAAVNAAEKKAEKAAVKPIVNPTEKMVVKTAEKTAVKPEIEEEPDGKRRKKPDTKTESIPESKHETEKGAATEHKTVAKAEESQDIKPGVSEVKLVVPRADTAMIPTKEINAEIRKGTPVIQVKNVSMEFKVSNSNASGLKDYAIQKVQGKLKYRRLKALDNISFDVYKGEVVGIIGSNGSGKSTLLKIVSGALRPTSGEVIADKDKIQLLTLGTGFDMELSARENVYLNGAIIGYSKDFIDKHYDEIVEFAELQDFMEEKVKNFSSGMISRLGFSIATVAGAAEILIMDEVLAVGDQFFRKKSLARVKEMIHGGSTVLIVSHSLPTIKSNCTKVVWIEKGVLKMVGTPQKVCAAYSKSHENGKMA